MPFTRDDIKNGPSLQGTREFVFLPALWDVFVDWVYDRGLDIFPIPTESEDEIPAYAMGFPPDMLLEI